MDHIYKLPATEMIRHLKSGEISPTEAVNVAFSRIDEVDSKVNAIPTLCRSRALKSAKLLEENSLTKFQRKSDPNWLAGLPVVIKDLLDVEGVRTTYGSSIYQNHVPQSSDILVKRIEENGGIVIGKSNTPEFGSGGTTFNSIFPSTSTPWDISKSSGGSSGGSAAALATGEIWLATGSDYGGSLRTPASFCGVVGLRPSPGRIAHGPRDLPFDTMAVEGPMARSVEDLAVFLDALTGSHPEDPIAMASPDTPFSASTKVSNKPYRAAFSPNLGVTNVDQEISEICKRAVDQLIANGWDITDDVPDFSDAMETFHTIRAAYYVAGMSDMFTTNFEHLKSDNVWNIQKGLKQTAEEVGAAEQNRGKLFHSMSSFFNTHDFLLCPTTCIPPFSVEWDYPLWFNGEASVNYMEWLRLPCVLSLTSSPVISLPIGVTGEGLPVGMQFCARYNCERELISAAYSAEQLFNMASRLPVDPL